jgi:hypothetical protein
MKDFAHSVKQFKGWTKEKKKELFGKLLQIIQKTKTPWMAQIIWTQFPLHRRILASPSRKRGLGKRTVFESLSPVVLSKSSPGSLCSQKTHRCASRFGLAFSLSLEFFRGSIAQRRVQPLPIVILFDELSDVPP